MKKKILGIIAVLSFMAMLSAADIETVIAKAKAASRVYQGYEISYSNSQLSRQQKDLKGLVVDVSGGINFAEKAVSISDSSVSLTLPEYAEDLNMKFNTAVSQVNLSEKKPFTLTPSFTVSKNWEIKSFTDTRENIEDLKTDIQTEVNHNTNIINFENSVINAIVSIMQAESKLKSSEVSYERILNAYNSDIYLGAVAKGGLADMEQTMRLNSTKSSLETMRENLEKSKKDFLQQYGIEYEDITDVRDADLRFFPSADGNSTVKIAKLNLESAEQNLSAQTGTTDVLSLNGKASTSIPFNKEGAKASVSLSASAKYSSSNWEVSTSIGDTFGKGLSMIPTVSVAGKWSNSAAKNKSDSLTEQMLYNTVLERENSYNSALYSYQTNVQSLQRDIENFKNDEEQLKIQTDYHRSIWEYQTELLNRGLASQQSVDDAKMNLDNDILQETILKLQALVLENRIKTIEL